jgi:phosphoribosylformylglycinamidine synthase
VSCHDLSEGGLAAAAAEMSIGSGLGANIFLGDVAQQNNMRNYEILFSESPTRFVVEIEKKNRLSFEKELKGIPFGLIGCVTKEKRLVIYGKEGQEVINLSVQEMRESWTQTFQEFR